MSGPFNPDIPGDYARALDRLERLKYRVPPAPRYPWPNPNNRRIKHLELDNLRLQTQVEETEAQADDISNAYVAAEKALWDVYVALGCDTSGDTGPGALIAGMGFEGFARMVVNTVKDYRAEQEA